LGAGVDLVVVGRVWEGCALLDEVLHPLWCAGAFVALAGWAGRAGEVDVAGLELGRDGAGAGDLVAAWVDRDQARDPVPEGRYDRGPVCLVFDVLGVAAVSGEVLLDPVGQLLDGVCTVSVNSSRALVWWSRYLSAKNLVDFAPCWEERPTMSERARSQTITEKSRKPLGAVRSLEGSNPTPSACRAGEVADLRRFRAGLSPGRAPLADGCAHILGPDGPISL
jgi:hypothetical protein